MRIQYGLNESHSVLISIEQTEAKRTKRNYQKFENEPKPTRLLNSPKVVPPAGETNNCQFENAAIFSCHKPRFLGSV